MAGKQEKKPGKTVLSKVQVARGRAPMNISGYVDAILRVSHLMARFPEIKELDINPVRLEGNGQRITALDARLKIVKEGCSI